MKIDEIKALTQKELITAKHIVILDEFAGWSDYKRVRGLKNESALFVLHNISAKVLHEPWFLKFVTTSNVCRFSWHVFTFEQRYKAEDQAFECVDEVYRFLNDKEQIPERSLINLYRDNDAALVYKKELIMQLCAYFRVVNSVLLFKEKGLKVTLCPSRWWEEIHSWVKRATKQSLDEQYIYTDENFLAAVLRSFKEIKERWMALGKLCGVVPWVLTRIGKVHFKSPDLKHYRLGIRLYKSGWGLEWEGAHESNWMIDEKRIYARNTLFVAETPLYQKYKDDLIKMSYNFVLCAWESAFKEVTFSFIAKEVLGKGFKHIIALFVQCLFAPTCFVRIAGYSWIEYLRWANFLQQYKIDTYFSYHDILHGHILRNILFEQAGCRTVYFDHSNSKIQMYQYGTELSGREALRSYLKYDTEILWSDQLIELERSQHNYSRKFLAYGPIWSEDIKETRLFEQLIREKWGASYQEGLTVAAFSTANSIHSINDEESHRQFLLLFEKLLNDAQYPNLKVLFKSKHPDFENYMGREGTDIAEIYKRLLAHPNFMLIDSQLSFSRTIYYADIAISMAFASPTIEALFAKRKAIYYDPCNKYSNSYFERFPNIVAHNEEECLRLFKDWLAMSDNEVSDYANQYIIPEYGGHLKKTAMEMIKDVLCNEIDEKLKKVQVGVS